MNFLGVKAVMDVDGPIWVGVEETNMEEGVGGHPPLTTVERDVVEATPTAPNVEEEEENTTDPSRSRSDVRSVWLVVNCCGSVLLIENVILLQSLRECGIFLCAYIGFV